MWRLSQGLVAGGILHTTTLPGRCQGHQTLQNTPRSGGLGVCVCVCVADDVINVQLPYPAIARRTKPYKTWYIVVELVRLGVAECILYTTALPGHYQGHQTLQNIIKCGGIGAGRCGRV